jgi:hypothetical protein
MNANANATFMNNLRPVQNQKFPVKARTFRPSSSDDKENLVNNVPADGGCTTGKAQSRLRRPQPAATILESKSSGISPLQSYILNLSFNF